MFKILVLNSLFDVSIYGVFFYDLICYLLYVVKSCYWNVNKLIVLIIGGVYGYEISGVYGVL